MGLVTSLHVQSCSENTFLGLLEGGASKTKGRNFTVARLYTKTVGLSFWLHFHVRRRGKRWCTSAVAHLVSNPGVAKGSLVGRLWIARAYDKNYRRGGPFWGLFFCSGSESLARSFLSRSSAFVLP